MLHYHRYWKNKQKVAQDRGTHFPVISLRSDLLSWTKVLICKFPVLCKHFTPQICIQIKNHKIVKSVSSSRNKAGGLILADFKIHSPAVIRTAWHWHEDRCAFQSRLERWTRAHICSQWSAGKAARNALWRKDTVLCEWCWENVTAMPKGCWSCFVRRANQT